ncbi:hypothetical protein Back11_03280 [Paenibacillus baekrokdamisoli]|uniref:Uncharacterized protein n=1 Tax=Paenibacillus baekrokdamisoli TaxID=1712516 RepID=A0A3G9J2R4_9BACL|nr:hypothetical protein Back11_03280 [Paenibacillus baekrokdamisoli]
MNPNGFARADAVERKDIDENASHGGAVVDYFVTGPLLSGLWNRYSDPNTTPNKFSGHRIRYQLNIS